MQSGLTLKRLPDRLSPEFSVYLNGVDLMTFISKVKEIAGNRTFRPLLQVLDDCLKSYSEEVEVPWDIHKVLSCIATSFGSTPSSQ